MAASIDVGAGGVAGQTAGVLEVIGARPVYIATRLNKLETKIGLRGPCRVCRDRSCLQIVMDTPDQSEEAKAPEHCAGCGRPPYLIRIVPAVPPEPSAAA